MGACQDNHHNQCGKFEKPSNPDDGLAWPYRQKMSCEAPALPEPECGDEYETEYNPDDPTSPFTIFSTLFDENCSAILDNFDSPILTAIV